MKVAVVLPEGVLRLVPVLVVEGRVPAPPPRLVGVVLRLLTLPPLLHPRPDRSSARAKNMAAILFGLAITRLVYRLEYVRHFDLFCLFLQLFVTR